MADEDKLVAAHLAAALIAKGNSRDAVEAVSLYRQVLSEIENTKSTSPAGTKRLGY